MNQLNLFGPNDPVPCPHCNGTGIVSAGSLLGGPGRVGSHHPGTAQHAARQPSNVIRFGTQRWRVLDDLDRLGDSTCAETAARVGLSRNQCATRLLELRDVEMVAYVHDPDTGEIVTRKTGPNDEGMVQAITAAGRAIIAPYRYRQAS
jgi:hypothetical protein